MCIAADPSRYLGQLVQRLREVLADRLSAVYALGSLALGGYEPQTSDIDVYAITATRLAGREKLNVACACSHSRSIPIWPAAMFTA
jgi:predicted nucleotidyltransferase